MKRIKAQRTNAPISLAAKRKSLNHQELFTPYKIDWKNNDVQKDNGGGKHFFQNMKAELSNIKNDFEKLIKKEISLKNDVSPTIKQKSYSSVKKDVQRKVSDSKNQNATARETEEHFSKILALERFLPCSKEDDKTETHEKTIPLKLNWQQPIKHDSILNQQNYHSSTEIVSKNLKEELRKKEVELQVYLRQLEQIKIQTEKNNQEKANLLGKCEKAASRIIELQESLQEKSIKIEIMSSQNNSFYELKNTFEEMQKESFFLKQRLQQVCYHNDNIGKNNVQIENQNNALKNNLKQFERYIEDMKKFYGEMENNCKNKNEYLENDLKSYQKREDMYTNQIEKLNTKFLELQQERPNIIKPCENSEVIEMEEKIQNLEMDLKNQIAINQKLRQNYDSEVKKLNFEELGRDFEIKVNVLVEQNCQLKSKNAHLEAQIQRFTLECKGLKVEIQLYQNRSMQNDKKQLSSTEWEMMTEKIEKLNEQNYQLRQELEYQNIKRQIKEEKSIIQPDHQILKSFNQSLSQIEFLRNTIKELQQKVSNKQKQAERYQLANNRIEQQLREFKKSVSYDKISEHLTNKNRELEEFNLKKERQVSKIKEVIWKVFLEKAGKCQDQTEIEYYLREFQNLVVQI